MLTPKQVIESEYLEVRCALLEIAAMFDRYHSAVERTGELPENMEKLDCLMKALDLLSVASKADRAEQLLYLFATV